MSAGTAVVTPCDSKGTWLVTLHGDHDLASRTALELHTGAIWRFCKVVVIDLSEATFVDSGVIRWLLSVERELEAAGASTLSIVEGPPGCAAARIFELLRMRHVMACYSTRAEAFDQAPASNGHGMDTTGSGGVREVRHAS
jgi:anti-anti-sigma regulatory factor